MKDKNDIKARQIKELVSEMKLFNNPELLEDTKKLLKKNVPLSMRGYLLAYLYVTSKHFNAKNFEKKQDAQRPANPRPEIEGAVSLYINVGKLSKAPAHALVQFICEETGLSEQDILALAFKQNYSFITVKEENAQKIIDKVNGATYRNRKVRVNFSKDKESNAD